MFTHHVGIGHIIYSGVLNSAFSGRKPDKTEVDEELGGCLHCSHPLPLTQLDCPQCKNTLPYCIITVSENYILPKWTLRDIHRVLLSLRGAYSSYA